MAGISSFVVGFLPICFPLLLAFAIPDFTLAVFIEEKKRKAKRGNNEKIVPLHLHSYDDEWKI